LQPSSPWTVATAREACHLARTFGEGDDKLEVDFRQYGPGRQVTLLALGKRMLFSGARKPLTTEFRPGGGHKDDWPPRVLPQPGGRGLIETTTWLTADPGGDDDDGKGKREWHPDAQDTAPLAYDRIAEAKVTELWIAGPIRRVVVLKLGRMDLPMDQMRTCLDGLISKWGLDPAVFHSLKRRPVPRSNPGTWARPGDYPQSMLKEELSGVVHFRLMVDESGEPTDCVVQSSASPDFDKATCKAMMKRAHFEPALDAAGKPAKSFYVNSVRWFV
jgi:TonB family protein